MKTKILFLSLLLTVVFANAQVPKNFNFQAVARNAQGQLIVSQSVSVKATLTANYNGGSYSEKHTLTTNQYGLFSLVVGKGTVLSGNINTMAWSKGVKLTVEFDPQGGTNFQLVSTTDLASVPYAIMADSAMKVANMPKKLCDLQLSACNQVISDVSSPVSSTDAVNKAYADAILARVKYLESVLSINYLGTTIAPTTVTDIDGNVYSTIKIGNQIWMKENLRVMRYADGRAISSLGVSAYQNNELNTPVYGKYYNWATAMDLSQTFNTATWSGTIPRQGVCPTGWHLPSDLEFETLTNYLIANGHNYDGSTTGNKIGKSLASTAYWIPNSITGDPGNTDFPAYRNKSGFTGIAAGYRMANGSFCCGGGNAGWWSVTNSKNNALKFAISETIVFSVIQEDSKVIGTGIRCIKD